MTRKISMAEQKRYVDPRNRGSYYQQGDVITIKQIVMEQVNRIVMLGSQEFRGGYNQDKVVSINGQQTIIQEYVQDSREAYTNAINNLHHILINERDTKYNDALEIFYASLSELSEKLNKSLRDGAINEDRMYDSLARKYGEKFELLLELLDRKRYLDKRKGIMDGE